MGRRNRRDFLKASALAGVGFWAAGGVETQAKQGPNERLNVAVIGCGGQGRSNLNNVANLKENIVALCDVDHRAKGGPNPSPVSAFEAFPKATRYTDFRVMLEKQKDIDAVTVSTPDHVHAHASIMAMRLGKHCYCEKPLTHSVWEARQMKETAAKHKVATQMGNQGTSSEVLRSAVEVIRSGAIGDVREVHVWTDRPIWPQGIGRPKEEPKVPEGVHWDLWIGPAPMRPFHEAYMPFRWRGWWDFGTGALGDMACHTMNLPFMALRLGAPSTIVAETTDPVNRETAPGKGCRVTYQFPARDKMPAVTLYWYERRLPPMELLQGNKPTGSGALLIGAKGTMYSEGDYGGQRNRLLPEKQFRDYKPP